MLRKMLRNMMAGLCWTLLGAVAAPAVWASDFPHGRDCATANPIQLGVEERTQLTNAKDRAVYRVVLEERGLLDVKANSDGEAANAELLDSACNPIGIVSGGTSISTGEKALITTPSTLWTLNPGVYFVRFDAAGTKGSGNPFTFEAIFTAHYGHDCLTAEPMELAGTKDGELLYPEDREVFRVDLAEPGQIHAWTTGPLEAPYVDIYPASCSTSIKMEAIEEPGVGFVTPVLNRGTYFLSVRPEPNALGRFTINVEFDGVPDIDYEYSDVPL
jgi:hypothetical protein